VNLAADCEPVGPALPRLYLLGLIVLQSNSMAVCGVAVCILSAAIVGCGTHGIVSRPAPRSAGTADASSMGLELPKRKVDLANVPTTLPPSSAVLFTEIPRWYRTLDPLSTYYFHPEAPPKGYRPLPERIRSEDFPGKEVAEIWGFEIGARIELAPRCDLLARDGKPCANVVYPGKRLDSGQAVQLMSIARYPLDAYEVVKGPNGAGHSYRRARMRCGDNPTAMFVFYDSRQRPIGVVGVDAACSQWSLWPAPRDGWIGLAVSLKHEQQVLVQLCRGLDLQTCAPTEKAYGELSDEERTAAIVREQRALLPLLLRQWPQVDETKALANVSRCEREQLCAWYTRSATIAASLFDLHPTWSFSGVGYEDEEAHKTLRLEGFEDCVKDFPRCPVTVGDARACITRLLEHFWDRNETCHSDCIWGIK